MAGSKARAKARTKDLVNGILSPLWHHPLFFYITLNCEAGIKVGGVCFLLPEKTYISKPLLLMGPKRIHDCLRTTCGCCSLCWCWCCCFRCGPLTVWRLCCCCSCCLGWVWLTSFCLNRSLKVSVAIQFLRFQVFKMQINLSICIISFFGLKRQWQNICPSAHISNVCPCLSEMNVSWAQIAPQHLLLTFKHRSSSQALIQRLRVF